jgi:hypothetical protein
MHGQKSLNGLRLLMDLDNPKSFRWHRLKSNVLTMSSSTKSTPQPIETCHSNPKNAKSSSKRGITKKTAEQLKDENFRRQKLTFAEKGDRLRVFDADVFILVRRKGKLMIYTSRNSLDNPQWPLRPEEIARYYPLPVIKTPETFESHERKTEYYTTDISKRN